MCQTCPCLGTPADILRLINNGYIYQLSITGWATGLQFGVPLIPMIQPKQLANGHCAFLTADKLCSLHNANLKPTEGKLAKHYVPSYPIALKIAKMWQDPEQEHTMNLIVKALQKHNIS